MNAIHQKGINDARVLEAMNRVPRHLFVPAGMAPAVAYQDHPQEIGQGQTISQPFTVAYQTALLNVQPGEKVLEIGTGSGYQSAILFELGARLYSVERQKKLFNRAAAQLRSLGYAQIQLRFGDGTGGWAEEAPFKKILVTAAAGEVPAELLRQLAPGGLLVIPLNSGLQKMLRLRKLSNGELEKEEFDRFTFVPLLPGTAE